MTPIPVPDGPDWITDSDRERAERQRQLSGAFARRDKRQYEASEAARAFMREPPSERSPNPAAPLEQESALEWFERHVPNDDKENA
jgi:hypothetical protein